MWWFSIIVAIGGTAAFIFNVYDLSKESKYKEDPNLSILSHDDAWNVILIGIAVVASLGGLGGMEIGVKGATLLGWIIGSGLSPLGTGSFLWVISLIWTKPKDRMLRLRQFVFWTTVFYMIGLWASYLL